MDGEQISLGDRTWTLVELEGTTIEMERARRTSCSISRSHGSPARAA
jgi:hypothetical protein